MSNQEVFEIPAERLPELKERLAKLNKAATKLSCPLVTYEVIDTFDKTIESATYSYAKVIVNGEAPKLNGWIFVATLEHDENGTIIRRIPTFEDEVDLTAYRTATPDNCDACGYKRRRNDTYIVASPRQYNGSTHNGFDTKQVGSSCLKDFLGHESPEQIARFCSYLRDLFEDLRGGSYDGGKITPRYSLHSLMDVADHVIANGGYISRRKSQETGEQASADVIADEFLRRLRKPSYAVEALDSTVDTDAVIEWVRSLDDKSLENDYLYNLYTVCKGDSLTARQFGIAASAITAYQREQAKLAERKASNQVDEFLGEAGDKVDVEFTVTQVFVNNGDYGISYKHIMRASTGHRLVWSTGSESLEQGKTYTGSFTVKGHRESKFGKETMIYRPRKGTLQEV